MHKIHPSQMLALWWAGHHGSTIYVTNGQYHSWQESILTPYSKCKPLGLGDYPDAFMTGINLRGARFCCKL